MKKQAYTLIGALVLTTMFAFATAQAQSSSRELIANVPFEFSAGSETLPSGKYTLTVINPASDQTVLRLRGLNGKSVVLQVHAVNGEAQDGAKLVFHRYGNKYFLAQAWTAADINGLETPRTRAEQASEIAGAGRRIETVALSTKKN